MARIPDPPYYAVIFTSARRINDEDGYSRMSRLMEETAADQPGFLGLETARDADGFGITISYWTDLASIRRWKQNADHLEAQARGRSQWYSRYEVKIAKVETSYAFEATMQGSL